MLGRCDWGGYAWWGGMHGGGMCARGVHGGGHAWQGGVHGRGVCIVGGMHGGGGGMCGRGPAWQGACVTGGMCGGGHAWSGGHTWQILSRDKARHGMKLTHGSLF